MTARAYRSVNLRPAAQSAGGDYALSFAHRGDPWDVAAIDVDHTAFAIDGRPAPLSASIESRQHDRPLSTRRREQRVVAQCAEARERGRVRARGKIGDVCFGHRLSSKGRRRDRERLGWRCHFAAERGRRHWPLLDGEDRIAGLAIKNEHEAAFRDLRDSVYPPTTTSEREEIRRCGKIAIPHVVVHGLEMPDTFSRFRIESEKRIREEIVANAIAAVEIGRRGSSRDVDDTTIGIDAHSRPRVRAARSLPCIYGPRLVARFAGM